GSRPSSAETATECVACRWMTAWFRSRSWYIARCRKLSLDGAPPEPSLPFQSSFDSRPGSSRPRLEPVGVSSQPSAQRAEMLPVEPWVRPRSKIDRPRSQICSRRALSCMSLLQLRESLREKVHAAKVARLERQRNRLRIEALGPRHARINLWPDAKRANAERADHRACGLAAGHHQLAHAGFHQPLGDLS